MIRVNFKAVGEQIEARAAAVLVARIQLSDEYVVSVQFRPQRGPEVDSQVGNAARSLQKFVNARKGKTPEKAELLLNWLTYAQAAAQTARRR